MAGERFAKITIQAALSHDISVRGAQTYALDFVLAGTTLEIRRGGGVGEFVVPDPEDAHVGEQYVMQCVQNMLNVLGPAIFFRGLPFVVSAPRAAGTKPDPYSSTPMPVVEFDIEATTYSADNTLDFTNGYANEPGFVVTSRQTNISPVFATADVTPALVYGTATGAITINATGGSYPAPGLFLYAWADGAQSSTRTNLTAGTYPCVISDFSSGASIALSIVVASDDRLDVTVQRVGRNVTLVIAGGVPPYAVVWADGSTDLVRNNLPPGTYLATVTDAHGGQVTVTVTITDFDVFYFSRNPVTLALQATDLASKPNLKFLCEVQVETDYLSGNFVSVAGVLTQPADAAGATVFDVSTLLDSYVQPAFPVHGETGLALARPAFCRFYLQHSEQWDGSGAPLYVTRDTHYLVYGGLDFFEQATQSYFTVYRPSVHPFLSWEPTQKEVFADQPEYLYYHHDSATVDTFALLVKFYYADGTSSTATLGQPTGVLRFEVWRAAVGLAQLRAVLGSALVSAQVVAWDVYAATATGGLLTEIRSYQLSEELPANRRYFLYANSVGGINTLATTGKGKIETDFANVLVQRSLQPGYDANAGETYTGSVSGVPVQRVNTGYLGPAQMDAFTDFLLSEEIRRYDADRYRPGSLQPATTLLLQDDDTGLLTVEFAFVLPTQRRYTPTLPLHF
ncbi:SprB repeat-containing protein [Hymenobacter baengnokdamensis]|uniref:SprB repeat-containing protein n=1 Tax=Hymenobacter baengnokdamensis TaxID=2615203 RepID=UPI001248BE61|nr:SprB repeat-containing protein [Hymenobacter baengnokdamensis]